MAGAQGYRAGASTMPTSGRNSGVSTPGYAGYNTGKPGNVGVNGRQFVQQNMALGNGKNLTEDQKRKVEEVMKGSMEPTWVEQKISVKKMVNENSGIASIKNEINYPAKVGLKKIPEELVPKINNIVRVGHSNGILFEDKTNAVNYSREADDYEIRKKLDNYNQP
jgi:hypothetical protein